MVRKAGAQVCVHDPYVFEDGNLTISHDLDECIKGASSIVIFTGHTHYKNLKAGALKKLAGCPHPIIVDGRNVVDPDAFIKEGFIYKGIGRGDKNNHDIGK
jgi:UDP-N-acetyl-D-mannosaminuronic acid dehydrogenase